MKVLTLLIASVFLHLGNAQAQPQRSMYGEHKLVKLEPATSVSENCGDYLVLSDDPSLKPRGVRIGFVMQVGINSVLLNFLKDKFRVIVDNGKTVPTGELFLRKDITVAETGTAETGTEDDRLPAVIFKPDAVESVTIRISRRDLDKAKCLPKP